MVKVFVVVKRKGKEGEKGGGLFSLGRWRLHVGLVFETGRQEKEGLKGFDVCSRRFGVLDIVLGGGVDRLGAGGCLCSRKLDIVPTLWTKASVYHARRC